MPTLASYFTMNVSASGCKRRQTPLQYFLVAICITLAVPTGIFVPSFVLGACGGRMIGELVVLIWPDGLRGPGGPMIYPGLYAVVGEEAGAPAQASPFFWLQVPPPTRAPLRTLCLSPSSSARRPASCAPCW